MTMPTWIAPFRPIGSSIRRWDSNWIYTAPGKPWFTFFRFYGPDKAVCDKTWQLPDIEKTNSSKQRELQK